MSESEQGPEPATEPTEVLEPSGPSPRWLLRSRNDRMIAGVAGGLGRYFAVDPVIVRIAFAISVFIGGLGILAYIALALFVPAEGEDGSEATPAPIERSRALAIGAGIGLVLIALSWGIFDGGLLFDGPWIFGPPLFLAALGLGLFYLLRNLPPQRSFGGIVLRVIAALAILVALSTVGLLSAWAAATGHGVAIATAVIAIGVLLVIAAFRGGARWLLAPAIAIAVPLGAVAAADVRFADGVGEREYTPRSVEVIPDAGYELGVGRLAVDLRELDWSDDEVLALDVDLGVGQALVAVPEDVCVTAELDSQAGSLELAGSQSQGFDPELDTRDPSAPTPRLELTGEVDFGEFLVINDDDADLDDQGRGHWQRLNGSDDERAAALEAACEPEAEPTTAGESEPQPGDSDESGATTKKRN